MDYAGKNQRRFKDIETMGYSSEKKIYERFNIVYHKHVFKYK